MHQTLANAALKLQSNDGGTFREVTRPQIWRRDSTRLVASRPQQVAKTARV